MGRHNTFVSGVYKLVDFHYKRYVYWAIKNWWRKRHEGTR